MRQPRAEMIAGPVQENLRLIFQPPKRSRVNDPGAVALKLRAIIVTRLGIFSPARIAGFLREGSERVPLGRFHLLARFPGNARNRFALHTVIIRRLSFFTSLELTRPFPLSSIRCRKQGGA